MLLFIALVGLGGRGFTQTYAQSEIADEAIFTIPIGMDGVLYEGVGVVDALTGAQRLLPSPMMAVFGSPIPPLILSFITPFTDAEGELGERMMTPGYIHNGVVFLTKSSGTGSATLNKGTIVAGGLRMEVEAEHDLGCVSIIGFGAKEDFFVIVTDLSQDAEGALVVGQTVPHDDASRRYLGAAGVPRHHNLPVFSKGSPSARTAALFCSSPVRMEQRFCNIFHGKNPFASL